jgi:hypothetical protein
MAFSGVSRECDLDTIAVWAGAGRGDPAPPGVNSVPLLTSPRERPASLKEHILKRSLRTRIST